MDNGDNARFEALIEGLLENDFGCCDDFINAKTLTGLRAKINQLNADGEMYLAGLSNTQDFHVDKEVRSDLIKWIEKGSINEFEKDYLTKIGAFVAYLNKTCFTSISDFECHYANYEQKSFYKRHLDQFKSATARKFSVVLYLNDTWLSADGGMLSLYPFNKKQIDISPLGGRLVFFKSNLIEHEVHPSFTKNRMSITGWLKSS